MAWFDKYYQYDLDAEALKRQREEQQNKQWTEVLKSLAGLAGDFVNRKNWDDATAVKTWESESPKTTVDPNFFSNGTIPVPLQGARMQPGQSFAGQSNVASNPVAEYINPSGMPGGYMPFVNPNVGSNMPIANPPIGSRMPIVSQGSVSYQSEPKSFPPSVMTQNIPAPPSLPVTLPPFMNKGSVDPMQDINYVKKLAMSSDPYVAERAQKVLVMMQAENQFKPLDIGQTPGSFNPFKNQWTPIGEQIPGKSKPGEDEILIDGTNPDGTPKLRTQGKNVGYYVQKVVNGAKQGVPEWKNVSGDPNSINITPYSKTMDEEIDLFGKERTDKNSEYWKFIIPSIRRGGIKATEIMRGRFATPSMQRAIFSDIISTEPEYTSYKYDNDKAFEKNVLTGNISVKVQNLKTAIKHADKAYEKLSLLNNSSVPLFNKAQNIAAEILGGDRATNLSNYEAVTAALAGEFGSLFKGGNAAATDPEIDNLLAQLKSSKTEAALKASLESLIKLGQDRILVFSEWYKDRIGKPIKFFNENDNAILKKHGFNVEDNGGSTDGRPKISW